MENLLKATIEQDNALAKKQFDTLLNKYGVKKLGFRPFGILVCLAEAKIQPEDLNELLNNTYFSRSLVSGNTWISNYETI